jgi:hypothetical protein
MIERREIAIIAVRDPHTPLLQIGEETREHEGFVSARQLSAFGLAK